MDIRHDDTPIFGFMAVGRETGELSREARASRNLIRVLAALGALFFIILLCTFGAWLVSEVFCRPCTVGAGPPAEARQQVTVSTTSPYDPVSCATGDGAQ